MSIGEKGGPEFLLLDSEILLFSFFIFFFFQLQKSFPTFLKISFSILALGKSLWSETQKPLGIFYTKRAMRNSGVGRGGAVASVSLKVGSKGQSP